MCALNQIFEWRVSVLFGESRRGRARHNQLDCDCNNNPPGMGCEHFRHEAEVGHDRLTLLLSVIEKRGGYRHLECVVASNNASFRENSGVLG